MPSLLSTLKFGIRTKIAPHKVVIKSVVVKTLSLLLIALLLEVFVFNFRT